MKGCVFLLSSFFFFVFSSRKFEEKVWMGRWLSGLRYWSAKPTGIFLCPAGSNPVLPLSVLFKKFYGVPLSNVGVDCVQMEKRKWVLFLILTRILIPSLKNLSIV
jgi:hypothetical protein